MDTSVPSSSGLTGQLRRLRAFSLTELMVVCTVLVILSAVTFPVARYTVRRQKEVELRTALREMRTAIDEHKRFSDAGLIPVDLGTEGYPAELEILVEGIDLVGQVDRQQRFLRRIPVDPLTGETEWGMRSVQDEWDTESWGGENVYDVFSLAPGAGLNGVEYSEW